MSATSERFIAHNWRHDWRVNEERENCLLQELPLQQKCLRNCYSTYLNDCVCNGNPPHYLAKCNIPNVIHGLVRDYYLVRVISLSAFYDAAFESIPEVEMQNRNMWSGWLDSKISEARKKGVVAIRDLILQLFKSWNKWSKRNQRPVWASFWPDVEPLLSAPAWADRVRDAFGLGKIGANEWLILLRYKVKEVTPCLLPTSLEADWVPWHFPSPPNEMRGRTMDLNIGPSGLCCPEVIHHPVDLKIEHWSNHIDRTSTSPDETDVSEFRQLHFQRLCDRFGDKVKYWMPSPI